MDKTKRNEYLQMFADVNELISELENSNRHNKTTENTNQLLNAYKVKLEILNNI